MTEEKKEAKTQPREFQIHMCKSMEEFLNTSGPEMTEEEWEAAKLQIRSLPSPQAGVSNKLSKP